MSIYNDIINRMQKNDRVCAFVQMFVGAISSWLTSLDAKIAETMCNFYFDTLTEAGVEYFESLLKITPSDIQTLDDRRYAIQAKWLMNNHNSIALVQRVCNSWKRGEVEASFTNGKIRITFVGSYGVPADLDGLLVAINEVKPAHLPYEIIIKYFRKREIHNVMKKGDMVLHKKGDFAVGRT